MEDTETSNLESKLIHHLIFVIEIIVIYKYNKFFKNMYDRVNFKHFMPDEV